VRGLVERTWPIYESGDALLDAVGPTSRPIIWLFTAGGQRVLRLIELWNYETVIHRPRLSRLGKLMLVARAIGSVRLGRVWGSRT
jgi:hypothetical protein